MNGSRVCVDASYSLKLVVRESGSDDVAQQWHEWTRQDIEILAPGLLWYEVTSTLAKRRRRGDLTAEEGSAALAELLSLNITTVDGGALYRKAYELSGDLGHTAAYDATYVAVAQQTGCALWTSDGGIETACKRIGVEVHLIS